MSTPVMVAASSWLGAAFLGLVQGLTEFLPVSSSGHLVLFQQFFEVQGDHILFDLVLHLGTLLPVLVYYREQVMVLLRDPVVGDGPFLERPGVRLWGLLIAASVPTAIIGLALKDVFEQLFATPAALAITFALTATLLLSTRFTDRDGDGEVTVWQAVLLGIAQGFAITPGISRSGTTIAVALALGIGREQAARFSFLMSVPAIGGAVLLMLKDADLETLDLGQLGIGFSVSLVSGYAALVLLVQLVRRGGLYWFSAYCFCAALAAGIIAYS